MTTDNRLDELLQQFREEHPCERDVMGEGLEALKERYPEVSRRLSWAALMTLFGPAHEELKRLQEQLR